MMTTRALLLALLIVVTACASGDPATVTTTTRVETTSTTVAATTTSTVIDEPALTTTIPATTSTTVPVVDVEIADGEVIGAGEFRFDLGETVSITVVSDVDDEIHVHGYDLFYDVEAGVPATIEFLADVPGVFEVEVHTGHTHIFDIEVSG